MVRSLEHPAAGIDVAPGKKNKKDRPPLSLQERSDKWMLAGCVVCGSFIFGPIGLLILGYGFVLLRRAQRSGEAIRPWAVTIIALYCMIDGGANFIGWAIDLFGNDAMLVETFYSGWGKLFDGAYYINYNGQTLGGTGSQLFAGEKALEIGGVLMLFPMRIIAAWGFFKMKRWGHQFMIISSWMYAFFWIVYMAHLSMQFDLRQGASLYGVTGYWAFNLVYMTPFIMLPYLHTVNKEVFTD